MLKHSDPAAERRALFSAVLSLKSAEDCAAFFADLCTPAELEALAGRWKVARLLDKGLPYREISEKTGISTATVTRVARCLTYGRDGGYRRLLDRAAGGSRDR
jgi:TrpR-related protein YerC/YecD